MRVNRKKEISILYYEIGLSNHTRLRFDNTSTPMMVQAIEEFGGKLLASPGMSIKGFHHELLKLRKKKDKP